MEDTGTVVNPIVMFDFSKYESTSYASSVSILTIPSFDLSETGIHPQDRNLVVLIGKMIINHQIRLCFHNFRKNPDSGDSFKEISIKYLPIFTS